MSPSRPVKICFVCLGNICRSPLAQGVFENLVAREALSPKIEIASAGTSGWHIGEPPDSRMLSTARGKGISLNSRARQFQSGDFYHYDLVFAMDRSNLQNLQKLRRGITDQELMLFRAFDPYNRGQLDVPDPYYGGDEGFEEVFSIVDRTCLKILDFVKTRFVLLP